MNAPAPVSRALLLAALLGATPACVSSVGEEPPDLSDVEDFEGVPDLAAAPDEEVEHAQRISIRPIVGRGNSIFANVLDRRETAWASVRDLSSSEFAADFERRKNDGMMPIDVDVIDSWGEKVSAVWQKNPDGRGWKLWRNLTSAQFSDRWNEYRAQGYILIDQDSYTLGGNRYYAGIWIENREGLGWASFRNATSSQYAAKFTEYRNAGYLPLDIEAYPQGGGVRYAAIWVENNEGRAWVALRDMSSSSYGTYFQSYSGTYRVMDLESYRRGGAQNYAAVWIQEDQGRGWYAYRDMSSKGYGDKWKQLRDAGYRVTDFEEYPTALGTEYLAIWRQSSDRPGWKHRAAVDALLEKAMDDFDIPGMSVAVAVGGEFTYLRGFGHANVLDGSIAHSRTVFRLASGSKAIAGTLALDLEERGLFDIDRSTRSYVPSMPTFHTHKVWHTLANRSGIGHYAENGSPSPLADYDTAEAALGFFEGNALEYAPGAGYLYSTHAYTAAGAALEGALGVPIAEIVDEEFTERYGLDTLKVEDRGDGNPDRSALYVEALGVNVPTPADNLSWKVLGGGLESSAYDYVRFGMKLLDGSILGQAALDRMWTPPDGYSKYGLGWDTGRDSCQRVVAKNGGQLGSNSYLRIYPDAGIVIAVLTNRQNGGHSATTLGRAIGGIVVGDFCP
jgi:CubicO group peptidase (beta-lactamase class C family)